MLANLSARVFGGGVVVDGGRVHSRWCVSAWSPMTMAGGRGMYRRGVTLLGGCLFVFYFILLSFFRSFVLFSLFLFHCPRSATVVSVFYCVMCECASV